MNHSLGAVFDQGLERVDVGGLFYFLLLTAALGQSVPFGTSNPVRRATFDDAAWQRRDTALKNHWATLFTNLYALNPEQEMGMGRLLDNLVAADVAYFRDLAGARDAAREEYFSLAQQFVKMQKDAMLAAEEAKLHEGVRQARQRYMDLQNGAPLMEHKIASALEAALPPKQAKAGRERYEAHLEAEIAKACAAARRPLAAGDDSNPRVSSVPGPPDPWREDVERIVVTRQYDDQQRTSADAILKDIRGRAAQLAASATAKLPAPKRPEAAGTSEGDDLKYSWELLHAELLSRVEELSRVDQIPECQANSHRQKEGTR